MNSSQIDCSNAVDDGIYHDYDGNRVDFEGEINNEIMQLLDKAIDF